MTVALITGAGRGLGRALALDLATLGMKLALHYHRSRAGAEETCKLVRDLGSEAEIFPANLSRADEASHLVAEVAAWFGQIDLLINNAGLYQEKPGLELTEAEWFEGLDTTVTAVYFTTRACLPWLRQSRLKRVINIGDSACLSPRRYRTGMLATEVMRDLFINQASSIDVYLAGQLVKILGVYPPGTFVRLQNGEVSVVVRRGKTGTTPLVISFIAPRGGHLTYLIKRDTREKIFAVRGGVRVEQKDMPYTMQQLWGKQAELQG